MCSATPATTDRNRPAISPTAIAGVLRSCAVALAALGVLGAPDAPSDASFSETVASLDVIEGLASRASAASALLRAGALEVMLRLFLDRSVLEVFIGAGHQTVTRVIYPREEDEGLRVFATDGRARASLQVWEMQPIW